MKNNTYADIFGNLMGSVVAGMNQAPTRSFVPGSVTGQLPGSQVPPSGNPYQMGAYGQTPSSLFDMMNQISLGISKF